MVNHIGGQHGPRAQVLTGKVAGQGVKINAQDGGVVGAAALGQKSGDETGQHVAAAALGHAGVGGIQLPDPAVGIGYGGDAAFEHHYHIVAYCKGGGGFQRIGQDRIYGKSGQTMELHCMGRQHQGCFGLLQKIGMPRQQVQSVGIQHCGCC